MAASGSNMFFPEMEEGTVLPGGIEVDVVDDMAAKDDARRRLFTALGVKTLDEAKVVELILHQHARKTLSEKPWSVGDVVEHAWFLFRAVARPSHGNIKQLLVASTDGKLRHGKETYMDVPGSLTPVSGILGSARTTVRFLHEQYLSRPSLHPTDDPAGPGNLSRKWLSWLDKSVGVRVLPKLAASGSVSAEFDMVINSSRANEWLQLLIKEPEVYSKELQAGENDAVRYRLANSKVLCTDGTERPLKDVYLPTFEVLSEPLAKGSVPMLMVDNPDDARWSSLDQPLHLRRGLDAHVFIAILLRMQGNRCPFTVDDVRRMYTGLARRYNYFVK